MKGFVHFLQQWSVFLTMLISALGFLAYNHHSSYHANLFWPINWIVLSFWAVSGFWWIAMGTAVYQVVANRTKWRLQPLDVAKSWVAKISHEYISPTGGIDERKARNFVTAIEIEVLDEYLRQICRIIGARVVPAAWWIASIVLIGFNMVFGFLPEMGFIKDVAPQ